MGMALNKTLHDKLDSLPPTMRKEVADFIDFLIARMPCASTGVRKTGKGKPVGIEDITGAIEFASDASARHDDYITPRR